MLIKWEIAIEQLLSGFLGALIATIPSVFYQYLSEQKKFRADVLLEAVAYSDEIYKHLIDLHTKKKAEYPDKKRGLDQAAYLQLYWTQPSVLERHFELYSDNILLGDLRFETASTAHGTLVTPGSAAECWTFKGARFSLKPCVTIRKDGTNDDLAVYRPKLWGGGWVEFVKGTGFQWKSTSFWGTEWGFSNTQEELLFVLKPKQFDLLKVQSVVEIGAQWHDLDELPLLLMLGWYLRVRDSYDTR